MKQNIVKYGENTRDTRKELYSSHGSWKGIDRVMGNTQRDISLIPSKKKLKIEGQMKVRLSPYCFLK